MPYIGGYRCGDPLPGPSPHSPGHGAIRSHGAAGQQAKHGVALEEAEAAGAVVVRAARRVRSRALDEGAGSGDGGVEVVVVVRGGGRGGGSDHGQGHGVVGWKGRIFLFFFNEAEAM